MVGFEMLGNLALLLMCGVIADPFSWFSNDSDDAASGEGETTTLSSGDDGYAGTEGDDRLYGMLGDDMILGEGGDDLIQGNPGDDVLFGNEGDDLLAGGGDSDRIYGGGGDDILSVDRQDDRADFTRGSAELLYGGNGDDVLILSSGDEAEGGGGADSFRLVVNNTTVATVTDFEPGVDVVALYYGGEAQAAPPNLTVETDSEAGESRVLLDGVVAARFIGARDLAVDDFELAHISALSFSR